VTFRFLAMLDRDHMLEPMLAACPTFKPVWDAFVNEWADEPELPEYIALGALARHLIGMLTAQDTEGLTRAFAVVERWHLDGDAYVREAATIGLLEALQNDSLHVETTPKQFEAFLLPETRRWWDKVERFWATGKVIDGD
jgi:hypothetical protein